MKVTTLTGSKDPGIRTVKSRKYFDFIKIFSVLFLFALSVTTGYSQNVPLETDVVADFGIDGDVQRDTLYFTGNPITASPAFGTDDWFHNPPNPDDPGAGVIDVTSAAALDSISQIVGGENESIELRMSAPLYSFPEGDGRLWIDAVYFRDQQTAKNNKDMSVFDQKINKNFNNPNTWTLKEGGVPPKNDLIDVMGHLRRAIPSDEFVDSDDEFAIAAASTRSENGDSYLDFEYYRKDITWDEGDGNFVSLGPDCGHSTYKFDLPGNFSDGTDDDGSVNNFGDIIMSVNYTGGGDNIDIRLFVWIDKRDFPTNADFIAFNALSARPFEFGDGMGRFPFFYCDGNSSNNFGYARIVLKSGETQSLFAQANPTAVPAPWWGTINSGGDLSDVYTENTFAEIAINATKFGFDTRSGEGTCENPLGSLLVKTRSSASFDSSLKDFAGPIDLGNTPPVSVSINNVSFCPGGSGDLVATVTPGDYRYEWFKFNADLSDSLSVKSGNDIGGSNPGLKTLTVTEAATYKLYATTIIGGNPNELGCFGVGTGVASLYPEPVANAGADDAECYDDNTYSISLDGSASGGTGPYSYSWSPATYLDNASLEDPTFSGAPVGTYTLTLTVTDANGCEDTDTVDLEVYENPTVTATGGILPCDSSGYQLMGSASGGTTPYSYYWTGPEGFTSMMQNPTAFIAGVYTLTVTDANGCEGTDTATVDPPENCAHIFPTQTDCDEYRCITQSIDPDPIDYTLSNVCITLDGSNMISNAVPGVFFYYADVIGEAGSTTVIVDQDSDLTKYFLAQNEQNVRVYSSECGVIEPTSITIYDHGDGTDQGDVAITFPSSAGTSYIISVKYDVKSIIGGMLVGSDPYASFTMYYSGGAMVSGSTGQISLNTGSSCDPDPIEDPDSCTFDAATINNLEKQSTELVINDVDVYPIPFSNVINIVYDLNYVSDVNIEIFDFAGNLLKTVKDYNVSNGSTTTINVDFSISANQMYMVRVTTDRDTFVEQIVSSKK